MEGDDRESDGGGQRRPHACEPSKDGGEAAGLGKGDAALLIIDALNPFDFEGAEQILPYVEAAAEAILALRAQARACSAPVIYVNDNQGDWRAGRNDLIQRFETNGSPGAKIAARLRPGEEDFFLTKPHFSAFYSTALPALLPRLGVRRLVLTGFAADICVLFTAADAHMREYDLWLPADAIAAEGEQRRRWALDIAAHSMGAQVVPRSELSFADWAGRVSDA